MKEKINDFIFENLWHKAIDYAKNDKIKELFKVWVLPEILLSKKAIFLVFIFIFNKEF